MRAIHFYNRGQSLIGIIIVLVVVGLVGGGLFYYLQKQIPEIPEITKKPAEEIKPEEITPPAEEELPKEERPVPPPEEITPPPEPEKPIVQKCADGTSYGQCSTNKPKYCQGGELINKSSKCGCPTNFRVYNDGCLEKGVIFTYEDSKWKGCDVRYPINNIQIKGVYFVPADKQSEIVENWKSSMEDIFSQIGVFFSREFNGRIKIKSEIYPSIMVGSLSTQEYDKMGVFATLDEIKKTVAEENPNFLKSDSSEFTSWMIYSYLPHSGGWCKAAFNMWFWLEAVGVKDNFGQIDNSGVVSSAHEFGHALGIPHPWDMAANVNNDPNFGCDYRNGSLMCHGGQIPGDLMENWIREDVKEIMGL